MSTSAAATAPSPLRQLDSAKARQSRPRIVFHRLDQIPPAPPRLEVVGGLLATREVVALVGAPGTGKSSLAVLAAVCLAEDRPFLGRPVTAGATVYIAAERAGEIERRLRAVVSPGAPIYVASAGPQLAEQHTAEELIEAVSAVEAVEDDPIRLIVVDTLSRCAVGLDENSTQAMSLVADNLARLSRAFPTAAVLVVHHSNKAGTGMRGSTALLGAVDLELTAFRGGSGFELRVTKANAVADGQRLAYRLATREAADGLPVVEAIVAGREGEAGPKAGTRLPPDARAALEALTELAREGSVTLESWHAAALEAYGNRKDGAKREAWRKSRGILIERGLVLFDGERVSVSDTSVERQQDVSADGGRTSARSVSAPPPVGGSADVADAPHRRTSTGRR